MGLSSFESDLLSMFLRNKKKYIKFSVKIKERHFRNEVLRWTYKVLNEYFSKYGNLPNAKVFKEELLKTSMPTEEKKQYLVVIKKLFKRKIKTPIAYMEENVAQKIEKEEILIAIDKALRNIESGSVSDAKKGLLSRIILGSPEEGDTMRVLRDWEARQKIREELSKIPDPKRFVPTPYHTMNIATKGIQISEAATVAGTTNMGKSIVAGEFGTSALLSGLNVLHFTLENLAEQTAQRYDSRLTEIEYDTIKLYEFSKSQLAHFKKVFGALRSSVANDVVIKETIKDETDITLIDKTVELLKLDGFDTEFLVVDSCDLMTAVNSYDVYRLDRASIYWDFKFYLKAKKLPGLTTTQLRSSAKNKEDVTVEDLSESYDKARILDIVYVMSQTQAQEKDNLVTFKLDKNRDGKKGISLELYQDFSRMRLLELA